MSRPIFHKLIKAPQGAMLCSDRPHSTPLEGVYSVPGSKIVATVDKRSVLLWRAGYSLEIIQRLPLEDISRVDALCLSSDGKRLLLAGKSLKDNQTLLVSYATVDAGELAGKRLASQRFLVANTVDASLMGLLSKVPARPLSEIEEEPGITTAVCNEEFSFVVLGTKYGELLAGKIYDSTVGWFTLMGRHSNSISCMAVSPNGAFLASASEDGSKFVFSMPEMELVVANSKNSEPIYSMVWAGDSKRLFIGYGNGIIGVWSVDDNKIERKNAGTTEDITALALSPDESCLFFGDSGHSICSLNTKTLRNNAGPLSCSNTPRCIIPLNNSEGILFDDLLDYAYRANLRTKITLERLALDTAHGERPFCVALSPDRRYAAVASNNHIDVFNARNGKDFLSIETLGDVINMAFTTDGGLLAYVDTYEMLSIVSREDGTLVTSRKFDWVNCLCMVFSSDNSILALAGFSGQVFLFDTRQEAMSSLCFFSGSAARKTLDYSKSAEENALARNTSRNTIKALYFENNDELSVVFGDDSLMVADTKKRLVFDSDTAGINVWSYSRASLNNSVLNQETPVLRELKRTLKAPHYLYPESTNDESPARWLHFLSPGDGTLAVDYEDSSTCFFDGEGIQFGVTHIRLPKGGCILIDPRTDKFIGASLVDKDELYWLLPSRTDDFPLKNHLHAYGSVPPLEPPDEFVVNPPDHTLKRKKRVWG